MNFSWLVIFFFVAMAGVAVRQRRANKTQRKILDSLDPNSQAAHARRRIIEDPEFGMLKLPEEIKCPSCAEFVKSEARVCRFCQSDISNHIKTLEQEIESNRAKKAKHEAEQAAELEVAEAEAAAEALEKSRKASAKRKALFQNKIFRISVSLVTLLLIAASALAVKSNFDRDAQIQAVKVSNLKVLEKLRPSVDKVLTACKMLTTVPLEYQIIQDYAWPKHVDLIRVKATDFGNYRAWDELEQCLIPRIGGYQDLASKGTRDDGYFAYQDRIVGAGYTYADDGSYNLKLDILPSWTQPSDSAQYSSKFAPLAKAIKSCGINTGVFPRSVNEYDIFTKSFNETVSVRKPPSRMPDSKVSCLLNTTFGVDRNWSQIISKKSDYSGGSWVYDLSSSKLGLRVHSSNNAAYVETFH